MITAMTAFLVALSLGLAALIHFAREDSFAGPGTSRQERDELGALSLRRSF